MKTNFMWCVISGIFTLISYTMLFAVAYSGDANLSYIVCFFVVMSYGVFVTTSVLELIDIIGKIE